MTNIKVYSTPTCPYCVLAKDFFKKNKIDFEDVDVAADQTAAQEMIEKTGQMGVPVIAIEKNGQTEYVVGFDQPKIAQILGLK